MYDKMKKKKKRSIRYQHYGRDNTIRSTFRLSDELYAFDLFILFIKLCICIILWPVYITIKRNNKFTLRDVLWPIQE